MTSTHTLLEGYTGPELSSQGLAQVAMGGMFAHFEAVLSDLYHPERNPGVSYLSVYLHLALKHILH